MGPTIWNPEYIQFGLQAHYIVIYITSFNVSCKRLEFKYTRTKWKTVDQLHEQWQGSSWPWWYRSWIYNYLCNQCLSPLMLWVQISIKTGCTTLCDQVCQWLAAGRWFSPGPPVFSTNKTHRHDITGIVLKVALISIKQTEQRYEVRIIFFSYNYIPLRHSGQIQYHIFTLYTSG